MDSPRTEQTAWGLEETGQMNGVAPEGDQKARQMGGAAPEVDDTGGATLEVDRDAQGRDLES